MMFSLPDAKSQQSSNLLSYRHFKPKKIVIPPLQSPQILTDFSIIPPQWIVMLRKIFQGEFNP
jgi:hypothetical protein